MIRRRNRERNLRQLENQERRREQAQSQSEQTKFPYAKVGATMVRAGAACFLLSCATAYFIMQDN